MNESAGEPTDEQDRPSTNGLMRLLADQRQGGDQRRIPYALWMRTCADELRPIIRQTTWPALAEALAGMGFKDKQGRPPSRGAVRKAWERIEAAGKTADSLVRPAGGRPLAIASISGQGIASQPAPQPEGDRPADRATGTPVPRDPERRPLKVFSMPGFVPGEELEGIKPLRPRGSDALGQSPPKADPPQGYRI